MADTNLCGFVQKSCIMGLRHPGVGGTSPPPLTRPSGFRRGPGFRASEWIGSFSLSHAEPLTRFPYTLGILRADIASVGGFFCGLNQAVLMVSSFTAEAAKRVLTGRRAVHISRHSADEATASECRTRFGKTIEIQGFIPCSTASWFGSERPDLKGRFMIGADNSFAEQLTQKR